MGLPDIQGLIQSLVGGGMGGMGGMGGGPGPSPAFPGMPPQPPDAGNMGLPEIPTGDSSSMGSEVQSISTQLSHIGAQLMSRGIHDAAISCAKAVKELSKVPQLISEHSQQSNPPPNLGGGSMGQPTPSPSMNMSPPPLPGMGGGY